MQTIVVTGGSSGIGAAVCGRFARRRDWAIVVSGRTPAGVALTAERCRDITDAPVATVVGDIRSEQVIDEIIRAGSQIGTIRAVVNNAGIGSFGQLSNMPFDRVREMIDVNLVSAMRVCGVAADVLAANGGGSLVNISSDADEVGFPGAVAYCSTKGGLLAASRALQTELGPRRVRVTVISPGRVDTCFNGKKPGMRPGALQADEVAEVVEFVVCCSANLEITQVRLDSLGRHTPCAP